MDKIKQKLKNFGLGLVGCVAGFSGCESMTPSEQAAVFGFGMSGLANDPSLNYEGRANAANLAALGYTLSQQEAMKEAAREGRNEVNVYVEENRKKDYSKENQLWQDGYYKLLEEYNKLREENKILRERLKE